VTDLHEPDLHGTDLHGAVVPETDASEATPALRGRVQRGVLWGAMNTAASRVVQFISTLIVARLLAPQDFGVLAVAIVVQTIALNTAELGATAALGRGDRDPDKIAPTVFTVALITSGILTLAMMLTAPWLAATFGNPDATGVIRVLSLTVALAGLASVPTAMVWREFMQRPRMVVDLSNLVVTLALVVPMALAGWGAMALAWSRVGGQLVATVGYWIISPRRYRPGFDRHEIRGIVRLGAPLALANVVAFATLNLDYVVVGRQLSAAALGLYLMAFNLASLPSTVVMALVRTVAVPAFGRLHKAGRLASQAGPVTGWVATVSFPVTAGLIALGLPLIVTLYGDRWSGAAVAMTGLALFGAARILTELFSDLCVGAGRTVGLLWVQVVWFVALAPAMLLGVHEWGIAGAGIAHAVVGFAVVVPIYLVLVRRGVGTPVSAVLGALRRPALGAVLAGVAAWAVARVVPGNLPALLLGGLTCLAVSAAVSWPLLKRLVRDRFGTGRRSHVDVDAGLAEVAGVAEVASEGAAR
jgi:O-antigen/teichoic acid export membrane protein